jgi:addiction module RelE/StbE family toxin
MYELLPSPPFQRRLCVFLKRHRQLAGRVDRTLRDLREDPFQPHLQTHPLHGTFAGSHGVSVTRDYRIVITIRITERQIHLIDIGTHDDVYR